jgi:ABC-type taurine transport system substrate-binding protein
VLFERVTNGLYEFKDSWVGSKEARAARGSAIVEKVEERTMHAWEVYDADKVAWQKEKANLRQMARVLGLGLMEVRRG